MRLSGAAGRLRRRSGCVLHRISLITAHAVAAVPPTPPKTDCPPSTCSMPDPSAIAPTPRTPATPSRSKPPLRPVGHFPRPVRTTVARACERPVCGPARTASLSAASHPTDGRARPALSLPLQRQSRPAPLPNPGPEQPLHAKIPPCRASWPGQHRPTPPGRGATVASCP